MSKRFIITFSGFKKITLLLVPFLLLFCSCAVFPRIEVCILNLHSTNSYERSDAAEELGMIGDIRAVEPLINVLKDDNKWWVREKAAEALGMIGDTRAVEPLIAALKDNNNGVRLYAMQALGLIGDTLAVEPLIILLTDKDWYVRWKSAETLDSLNWKPQTDLQKATYLVAKKEWRECIKMGVVAVEPLIVALKDNDDLVRSYAAEALGNIGDARAVEPLINSLKDNDSDVRESAAEALGNIEWKPPTDYQKAVYLVAMRDWQECVKIGADAVEPLIVALKDNDDLVRSYAAEALGNIGDPRAVEPLINVLKDDNKWWVREKAAKALGEIGDAAIDPLIVALKDNDIGVRENAAEALGEIGDARAVEPLMVALKDNDSRVRFSAAKALGEIGDLRAVIQLIAALKDNDHLVRSYAAVALGKTGDARAVEPLIVALKDNDDLVRSYAAVALDKLNFEPQSDYQNVVYLMANSKWQECVKIGNAAVEPLIILLTDKDWYVRTGALVVALGEIGDARAVEPLIVVLKDNDHLVRSYAAVALGKIGDARAVEPLINALNDKDWQVQESAAKALGEIGDARAIPRLVYLLRDWYVGNDAFDVLNVLDWEPKSVDDTIHLLVVKRNGDQLKQMWEDTKRVLLNDVTSNNSNVIKNALYAFIGIGKQEIIPDLINILNKKGTKTTAEAYLNCGNKELSSAAKSWASKHGYYIQYSGGSSPVRWGGM